jgi:hypothetical protein
MNQFEKSTAIQGAIAKAQAVAGNEKYVMMDSTIRRLEQRVSKLEREIAATNAAALLILGEDLARMKQEIAKLKKK